MTPRPAHRSRRRSGDRWRSHPWLLAALPVALVALADPLQRVLALSPAAGTAVVGVTEAAVAAAAAVLSGLRARRERAADGPGRRPGGWWLLTAATGSWAAGQCAWVVYESVLRVEVPAPSFADVGFLGFGALAPLAVVAISHGAVRTTSRVRSLLDGVIIAVALFLISWTLVLGVLVHQVAPSLLALLTSAAYPVSDIIALTTALAVLSRSRADRALVGISVGVALMAVSDSLFVYLSAAGEFSTGGLLDVLWTAAFAVIAASTLVRGSVRESGDGSVAGSVRGSVALKALPYVPFAVATVVVVVEAARRPLAGTTLAVLVVLMTLVFVRQALVVLD
ncbi:hypothetical protein FHN55_22070, partial [Streptomyces sp. NP160]